MDLNEYQKKANRTVNTLLNENEQMENVAMGLAGEAGGFADMVKKFRFQGHDFDRELAIKEIGDVMWYCALGARELGVSLNDIARMNIEKLEARYPENEFDVIRSIKRDEYEMDA